MSITQEAPTYLATNEPGVFLAEMSIHDREDIAATMLASSGLILPETSLGVTATATKININKRIMGIWDDDTLVGAVSLMEDKSPDSGTVEFWLDPSFTGCGYATTALLAVTKHALKSLRSVSATIADNNDKAAKVLMRANYEEVSSDAGTLTYEARAGKAPTMKAGVMKMRATNGSEGGFTNSAVLDLEPDALEHLIKKYSGSKNKSMQGALAGAVDYLKENPLTGAADRVRGLGGNEPTINNSKVGIWRLKPSDAPGLKHGAMLRDVRILYGIIDGPNDEKVLAILDIIHRGDFEKKYT